MDASKRFQDLLRQLFQFDMADLDFGLYRLLRLKRDELEAFITEQLPRKMEEAFDAAAGEKRDDLQAELDQLTEQIREKIAEDAITPKYEIKDEYKNSEVKFVKELVGKYEEVREQFSVVQTVETERADVFNHLYNFFSRYYQDGDFIPKRYYSVRQTYAVPYDGSEVFFHWANRDQHYVKTAETLKDYAFKVGGDLFSGGDWRLRFELTEASVSKDNVKGDRRFFFPRPDAIECEDKVRECRIPFEYRPPTEDEVKAYRKTKKGKQPDQRLILESQLSTILEAVSDESLRAALSIDQRTQEDIEADKPELPLLLKRMLHYCRRSTSDFFIHKNLGRFLLEELEFYVKDQVLHIEDLEGDFEARRRMIWVLRRLGEQVINFLAQIEETQKQLFEKKKFVLETSYLIPIQNIPQDFWPDVLKNSAQQAQWKNWFALKRKVSKTFLKKHPTLVVDTRHFDAVWIRQLLEALPFEDLDEAIEGLLIRGENHAALSLLSNRYRKQIGCVFIDPPYNTGSDEFIFKDRYQHSSWLAMMASRLARAMTLLDDEEGLLWCTLDDNEGSQFELLIKSIFRNGNMMPRVIWQHSAQSKGYTGAFSVSHNYVFCIGKSKQAKVGLLERTEEHNVNYSNPDNDPNGPWRSGDVRNSLYRPNLIYKLRSPSGKTINPPPKGWRWSKDTMQAKIAKGEVIFVDDETRIMRKIYLEDQKGRVPDTIWLEKNVGSSRSANRELKALFGSAELYATPKPTDLIKHAIVLTGQETTDVLDYFAGSGTTGHAVINLNRADQGERKFILIEMADYFDTVLMPRIAKVMYAPEWKGGKPERETTAEEAERTPRIVKVLQLESYEDALHNLAASSTQERAAAREKAYKEVAGEDEYRLNYLVSIPSEASDTMLNLAALEHPFDYTLEVLTEHGPRRKHVDLTETFNYLYGLRVQRLETWVNKQDKVKYKGSRKETARIYHIVKAMDREHKRRVLVVWRDMNDLHAKVEREFLEAKIKELTEAGEVFDELLINGNTAAVGFTSLDPLFKMLMMAKEEEAE